MSASVHDIDFHSISVEERLQLLEKIWDSVVEEGCPLPLTDGQKRILNERLEEHRRSPDDVIAWEDVKKEGGDGE